MKMRFSRNRNTGHRELVVSSGRNEALNPKQAAWLKDSPHARFLPMRYACRRNGRSTVLRYDVEGLVCIASYVKKVPLGESVLTDMLVDLAVALAECSTAGNRYFSMLLDEKHVFVDAAHALHFAFVPLDGLPFEVENSPLALLRLLSNQRRVTFETPNDEVFARHLAELVVSEGDVFSLNAFRQFLSQECGVTVSATGIVDGRRASSWHRVPLGAGAQDTATSAQGTTATSTDSHTMGQAPSVCCLVRVKTGERFYFSAGEDVRLGRGAACRIQLHGNALLSRDHALLRMDAGVLTLQDNGSANGTFVAGRRLPAGVCVRLAADQHFFLEEEEFYVEHL